VQVKAGVSVDRGKREKGDPVIKASILGYTRYRTSMPRNASTARQMVASVSCPRSCRPGQSSIVMTSDVYGHLFPRGDDADELAWPER
jgi:integrase